MTSLPPDIQTWLESRLQQTPSRQLQQASQNLSERYRRKIPGRQLSDQTSIEAYLAARMPATYAVVTAALQSLRALAPDWQAETLCDLGAGPGTASLAVQACFPDVQRIELIEREPAMIQAGKALFQTQPSLQSKSHWHAVSLPHLPGLPRMSQPEHHLTLLSYVLNELSQSENQQLAQQLLTWPGTLIVIEPGTPEGFQQILNLRTHFLQAGWQVWGPCPHQQGCPLTGADWCHFSTRLPRSAVHRALKSGSQNYEDEKFAYLILNRAPAPQPALARILRHPMKYKGHLELTLCTDQGLKKRTVSRSDSDYRLARKAEWGDSYSGQG